MTDWFWSTWRCTAEGALTEMVDRAVAAGLPGAEVRAALLRGGEPDQTFVELALRLQQNSPDQHLRTLSTELVMRLLDDADPGGTHTKKLAVDDLFGDHWRNDPSFEPRPDQVPMAFVVTGRDPVRSSPPDDDGFTRDEWVELTIWIASRRAPWSAEAKKRALSAGSAAYAAYQNRRDCHMSRFPPSDAAAWRWARRIELLTEDERAQRAADPDALASSYAEAVALSLDGRRAMVVDGGAKWTRIFDVATGERLQDVAEPVAPRADFVPFLATDPVEPRVIGNGHPGGALRVRDWEGRVIGPAAPAGAVKPWLVFGSSGEVVGLDDVGDAPDAFGPECTLRDRATFAVLRTLAVHDRDPRSKVSAIRCIGVALRAPVGATGDALGFVSGWSTQVGPTWKVRAAERAIHAIAVAPDGSTVHVVSEDGWLCVLDATDGRERSRRWHAPGYFELAMSSTGETLVIADGTGVWFDHVASEECVRFWPIPGAERFRSRLDSLQFSRDGRTLCVASSGSWLDVFAAGRA